MRRTGLALAAGAVTFLQTIAVSVAQATDFLVHNAAEITTAQSSAAPGDTITMADGVWTNQSITFSDTGTAAAPITLRAQTPGRVILTGTSKLTISGDYLVASGLTFKDGSLTSGNIVSFTSSSSHSRLTSSALIDYDKNVTSGYHWVHVDGMENRIDHNFFKGHTNDGVTLEIFPAVDSRHQIDNNQFVDRPTGSGNGFETIRLGLSSIQTRSAKAVVENNLFERTDGELEIISVKSSDNIIRNNTIRDSDGTITLRHGSGSTVSGNFILGENKTGSGGIRVIGPNQTVVNNYMSDLDTNAISLTTGYSDWDVNTTATGYEPVDNALIAHNTIVNVNDQIVTRDAGYTSDPTSTRNIRPKNVKMVNNIFWSTHQTLIQGTEGPSWTWAGNLAFGTTVGKTDPGISNVNPQLVKDAKGIWRPAAGSPAINSGATGPWALPGVDMDGQPRTSPYDIGADEVSGAAMTSGPLSASDVGPAWLKRRSMSIGTVGVPIIMMEAEDYTAMRDPNGDGDAWQVTALAGASGGFELKAPGGGRTDLPGTHDAIVEYDVAFHDPGTYHLYVLCRGLTSGSDSLYAPATLGADPTIAENLPRGTGWVWLDMATYDILAADVNRPITLQLGKREAGAEIDMLVFSPVALDLAAAIPEPASLAFCVTALALLSRRCPRPRTTCHS